MKTVVEEIINGDITNMDDTFVQLRIYLELDYKIDKVQM